MLEDCSAGILPAHPRLRRRILKMPAGCRRYACAACACSTGERWRRAAVIVTTGTFLNGLIHCGENQYPAGRSGEPPSVLLGEALRRLGFEVGRLKTGTPPRLDARTIDFSRFQVQAGDPDSHAVQLSHQGHYPTADGLLDYLHQCGDPSRHSRERASRPALFRADQGHRTALLPLH